MPSICYLPYSVCYLESCLHLYPHSIFEETKIQESKATCQKSHSCDVVSARPESMSELMFLPSWQWDM